MSEPTSIRCISEITVREVQRMGGDHMVVAAARVSTSGEEALKYADPTFMQGEGYGLIKYLMKHRHGTPFEHSAITFFVHAPIFVWREWHRHRIASYNEESGRYKQLEPVFYLPPSSRPMFKIDDWKPGRPKFLSIETDDHCDKYAKLCNNLRDSYLVGYANYEENLRMGFDPGLARDCLPVGIYSSCWVTINPRALMGFLSLRTHEPDALFVSYPLYEMEVAARKVETIFAQYWPLTYKAFNECGRVDP